MPDVDIDEIFDRFKSGGPLMTPAGPDAARRISERRRRARLALAAAAAVVVVTVGASVVAYDLVPRSGTTEVGNSPTPTAPPPTNTAAPTSSPSPTSEAPPTDEAGPPTLQQSDVPSGFEYEGDTIRGDWSLEFAASMCVPPSPLAGVPSATNQWEALFRAGIDPNQYIAIHQRVADFDTTDGAEEYLVAVHRLAQGCERIIDTPSTWTVTHQGFAGDESLILRHDGAGSYETFIVVRVDDLVTQIQYTDDVSLDPVQLGRRAAARMCAATTAC